jgi:hypothetical protein
MEKEIEDGQSEERSCRAKLQVRLQREWRLSLQPLHLQELQLLRRGRVHPRRRPGGAPFYGISVKLLRLLLGSSLALGMTAPADAQMDMPGMKMPAPAKHVAKKKAPPKTTPAKKVGASIPHHSTKAAAPSKQQTMPDMTMPMPAAKPSSGGAMQMPMPQAAQQSAAPMSQMQIAGKAGHGMAMTAALGSYPIQRESSGTAWQPDSSEPMSGPMAMSGGWMFMAHGVVNFVYDHQSGSRGDNKAFASGMLMGMASHPLGDGTVQFKTMLSPDPLMGPRGYPLLLASGETANGRDRLIDRQHPHDFFMELSGSVSQNIGSKSSLFVYAGLPGEPAFGPPSFMHRESIMDSPEAPISHHWLDSTHISFGVVTAGVSLDRIKLEVSRFNGREPDQHRWNIETGPLDSTSVRVSWNPTRTLALQGSWGYFKDPEQLEPGVSQKRLSASALWANDFAPGWHAAATLAWGRKTVDHHNDDAFAAEASVKHTSWTFFGRGEMTENRELVAGQDAPAYRVGKVSLGAVRDFRLADHLSFGTGGLFSVNFVPHALAPLYGSHKPTGAMAFVRLKLD